MQTPLQANLQMLRTRCEPGTWQALSQARPDASPMLVEAAPEGHCVFSVTGTEGRRIHLHSRRAPVAEAQRQVERWLGDNPVGKGTVVILGAAGFYHVEAFAAVLPPGAAIIVVDLCPAAVVQTLAARDLTDLGRPDIVVRCIAVEEPELARSEYRQILCERPSNTVLFFRQPGTRRAFGERYGHLHRLLAMETRTELMSRCTVARLGCEWQLRALANLPYLVDAAPIDLFRDAFSDLPALVVAAGPSLTGQLPLIARVRDRVVVVAVGTALRPLRNAGIVPDFVVTIDSSPKTWRQFDGIDPDRTHCIAGAIAYSPILERYRHQLIQFSCAAVPEFCQWQQTFGGAAARLEVGGTVTLSAIDAAVFMGCAPIILLGFDLAFRDDGTTHAFGTMYDGYKCPEPQMISVPGNAGVPVRTTTQFRQYIEMVSQYLWKLERKRGIRVYNANRSGARIGHVVLCDPDAVPAMVPATAPKDPPAARIAARHGSRSTPSRERVRDACRDAARDLHALAGTAERAVDICDRLRGITNASQRQPLFDELAAIDVAIRGASPAGRLLDNVLSAVCMELVTSQQDADAPPDYDTVIDQNDRLYSHLRQGANQLASLLHELTDEFAAAPAGELRPNL